MHGDGHGTPLCLGITSGFSFPFLLSSPPSTHHCLCIVLGAVTPAPQLSLMARLQPGEGAPADHPISLFPPYRSPGCQWCQWPPACSAAPRAGSDFGQHIRLLRGRGWSPALHSTRSLASIQGAAVTCPGGWRSGFALRNGNKAVSSPVRPAGPPCCGGIRSSSGSCGDLTRSCKFLELEVSGLSQGLLFQQQPKDHEKGGWL